MATSRVSIAAGKSFAFCYCVHAPTNEYRKGWLKPCYYTSLEDAEAYARKLVKSGAENEVEVYATRLGRAVDVIMTVRRDGYERVWSDLAPAGAMLL